MEAYTQISYKEWPSPLSVPPTFLTLRASHLFRHSHNHHKTPYIHHSHDDYFRSAFLSPAVKSRASHPLRAVPYHPEPSFRQLRTPSHRRPSPSLPFILGWQREESRVIQKHAQRRRPGSPCSRHTRRRISCSSRGQRRQGEKSKVQRRERQIFLERQDQTRSIHSQ